MGYLDLLDGILRGSVHKVGRSFASAQAAWIECQELSEGGFAGRRGKEPDVYYTDFALRALDLLSRESPVFETTARRLQWGIRPPADLTDVFGVLSCARTLRRHGHTIHCDRHWMEETLMSRAPLSAYQTFLSVLCRQMLGEDTPHEDDCEQIASLQRASGGFAERGDDEQAQTNATSAAMAVLLMGNALERIDLPAAAQFIVEQQAADGGLAAHPEARGGDLLSTFTGLLTLTFIGASCELDLPALGHFVRGTAQPAGGFGALPGDPQADVEYTFYGVATLGLLRSLVEEAR